MRILIIDDHAMFRAGLKMLLTKENSKIEVAEAGNIVEAREKVINENFEIVLLDIGLPNKNGIEVLKSLKQINPKLLVLVLSMYPEEQYAFRAIRAGASGYLTKDAAPDLLIYAISRIKDGGKYISKSLAEKMANQLQSGIHDFPHTCLSDREYDILIYIASGKTVSEIAIELNLSVKTISTYRTRILKKMNLKNNAELMRYVVKHLTEHI